MVGWLGGEANENAKILINSLFYENSIYSKKINAECGRPNHWSR